MAFLPWQPTGPILGEIRPPGSKSLTNRAVLCAALAQGESQLTGLLQSEDTEVMIGAWRQLGVAIEWNTELRTARIAGSRQEELVPSAELYMANSGTSLRFMAAVLAGTPGSYRLVGNERMHQRPVGDLLAAITSLGGTITSENPQHLDCPPLKIEGCWLAGGETRVKGDVSSQFLSALLMAAPRMREEVRIAVEGSLVSQPYIAMTIAVMRAFGVEVLQQGTTYQIRPQQYEGCCYAVEPDASAASYYFAAAAITGGCISVLGLGKDSLQGDVRFVEVLERMGCEVTIQADRVTVDGRARKGKLLGNQAFAMGDISDTVQTLAAVALFADGPTTITGVAHNRFKESDRIGDLSRELRRLGARVEESPDGLTIHPQAIQPTTIETYDDHRMAMSLSLVGLRIPQIRIANPECTKKTYPKYFDEMQTLIQASHS